MRKDSTQNASRGVSFGQMQRMGKTGNRAGAHLSYMRTSLTNVNRGFLSSETAIPPRKQKENFKDSLVIQDKLIAIEEGPPNVLKCACATSFVDFQELLCGFDFAPIGFARERR